MSVQANSSRQSDTRKRTCPRISECNPKLATVLVGGAETRFVVHEHLLVYHSEFFRAALTGHFKEAEEKTVRLKDVKRNVFEFFVHWLYYQRLPDRDMEDDDELIKTFAPNTGTKEYNLVRLHVLADKYTVPPLRRLTMDVLYQISYIGLDGEEFFQQIVTTIIHAFDNLQPESALCRFLIDAHCSFDNVWTEEDAYTEHLPRAFLTACLKRHEFQRGWLEEQSRGTKLLLHPCDYHEHSINAEREACSK